MKSIKNGSDLAPKQLWDNFTQILNVPRPSKKEEKIVKFIKEFGENLNLDTLVDKVGNVIIKKPATPGMENLKTVVIQAHLDMVPQKNNDTVHNFETDPISAYVEDGWVKAEGTTLGADNGIGVAAMMSVLESKELQHGPIEALFTADEETGMTGAFGLQPEVLNGSILLNLDTEEEGELYIGCAGGIDTNVEFSYSEDSVPENVSAYKITVKGLKGGHSGADIHMGKGNANKIMNRVLWIAAKEIDLRVSSINGGGLRNAIPRESTAIVTVPKEKEPAGFISLLAEKIKSELTATEPTLTIKAEPVETPSALMTKDGQNQLLNTVYAAPNGVIRMADGVPGLVETSTNMAQVIVNNGNAKILFLTRSSVDTAKIDVTNTIQALFELVNAKIEHTGTYPGWNPDMDSEILNLSKDIYKKMFGKDPKIKAIHAGLECGLFKSVFPDMDMLSIGPDILNPHSPDEMTKIESVKKFWDYFVEILNNIPKK
jgi:dipeptidase D